MKNCLFKFNAVERLMLEKMRQIMQTYVMSDPNLKAAVSQHANHWKNDFTLFILLMLCEMGVWGCFQGDLGWKQKHRILNW